MTSPGDHFLDRLSRVVAARPDGVAVLERGEVALTYAGLWDASARLGGVLSGLGIGREAIVGLALEKSADWVVGALGSWWAGAAYLPIDPGSPRDRHAAIVRKSRLALVIARPGLAPSFEGLGVPVISPEGWDDEPRIPRRQSRLDDLAYVIFTSGSTGRPKGVLVTHRGVVPLADAQIPAFGLRAGCRSLWLLSPVFDASLSDVATALLSGATLCIEDPTQLTTIDGLVDLLDRRAITHLDLPPALLRVLDPDGLPRSLATLIIGGEPSPPEVVRRFAARLRVVNVYGPTEATVCSSLCACSPQAWDQPLLGEPIAGAIYQVLDDQLEPVGPGQPGELCIAGPGLARGYLDEPELTAAKFVDRDGLRLYRTGDRVLIRRDGAHVFLGRVDRQVKIRGRLIEPEEVEARLLEHPDLIGAAVVKRTLGEARADREGLVAFVVARDPSDPPLAEDLKEWLARSLPLWMIPQHLVCLSDLPTLDSGKTDLTALGSIPLGCREPATDSDQPAAGSTAGTIAAIWLEVLGLDAVNPSRGFAEHGGDSLSLMKVVAQAYLRGLSIPIAVVESGWTIAEIARWLDDRTSGLPTDRDEPPPGVFLASDLRAEVAKIARWPTGRDATSCRPDPDGAGPPRSVLFTGATGHLGSRLLGELLLRTEARFHVLVRASDRAQGLDRLRAALGAQGFDQVDPGRIRIIPGDLGRPGFGIERGEWNRLAQDVDTIFHNAARVHLVEAFETLRGVNLLGTREIVRFQALGRRKRLHHASTLSVFVATDRNRGRLREDDTLERTRWVHGGYAQTKWSAEILVRAAGAVVGPTGIYRLGLITGDSATGRSAPGDFLTLFLRGLIRLGAIPRVEADLRIDVTPVDFAARALAHLALQPSPKRTQPATFHLANPVALSFRELVAAVREAGIRLEEIPAEAWRARIESAVTLDPAAASAVLALCRALPTGAPSFESFRTMDLFQATDVEFDRSNAIAGLDNSGIDWPAPGRELLRRYLSTPAILP